jgi:hypothetical protein
MMKDALHRRIPWLALSLVLAVTGCEGSVSGPDLGPGGLELGNALLGGEADVMLRTDADSYAPGGSMTLTLENQGSERVGYNLCVHGLERRSGDAWTSVESERVCTAHLEMLEPGQTASYETTVPEDLASGEYRVRLPLYLPGREEQRDVVSGTFQVGG